MEITGLVQPFKNYFPFGLSPSMPWKFSQTRLSAWSCRETFEKPFFTPLYELFDPCPGLLTKSRKLGLTASNSSGFTHWRGPFASPGWVPQKVHNCRSKGLCKGLAVVLFMSGFETQVYIS